MFWILYTTNLALFIYGIYTNQYNYFTIAVAIFLIIRLWQTDSLKLKGIQSVINDINSNKLVNEGKEQANKFKNLNWFQKIIYLTAFKAGAEYIIRKIKQ